MQTRIKKYLHSHKVLTFCTCVDNQPYSCYCFYVFDETGNLLIFLSGNDTTHIQQALKNPMVSGTIESEHQTVAKIKGIQFQGVFIHPNEAQKEQFYNLYYKKFPFAKAKPSPVWGVALTGIKMTDNTLGFGKKLLWNK